MRTLLCSSVMGVGGMVKCVLGGQPCSTMAAQLRAQGRALRGGEMGPAAGLKAGEPALGSRMVTIARVERSDSARWRPAGDRGDFRTNYRRPVSVRADAARLQMLLDSRHLNGTRVQPTPT